VSVRDNGNGIDAQHLVRMFEPFFTTKSGGMGLGLAVSRRIIEAHKGALRAQTNPNWGLTLAFTLPVPRRRVS
jgi:signal transduction histidine kinase